MIGIDKINFYIPEYYIDLEELAVARGVDPNKFTQGIGQNKMSIAPPSQDIVSMGANAAYPILDQKDKEYIDLVIVATESSVDQSKSAAVFIHDLLEIQPFAKSIEIKQACYSLTAALYIAKNHIENRPSSRALIIGSDISKYGLNTPGEVTQGAGAVAMVISKNPSILSINNDSISLTDNIFDFWRPNYMDTAIVDGKYSTQVYKEFYKRIWNRYSQESNLDFNDFHSICFHLPYSKMGKKALESVIKKEDKNYERIIAHYYLSTLYGKEVGNIYTASIYLSFISLLEKNEEDLSGKRIGFFSYGSGAVGEFFSGFIVDGYKENLLVENSKYILENRKKLTIAEYEDLYKFNEEIINEWDFTLSPYQDDSTFILDEISEDKRIYKKQ